MAAYFEADREVQAPALREAIETAGYKTADEHAHLLDIEEALESAVRDRLEGRKGAGATKALKELRTRLEL